MKASPLILGNNLLERGKRDGVAVTPMKLQKLLYYVSVRYLQATGTAPIAEQFQVWKSGPVLASVYVHYREYQDKPIKRPVLNQKGKMLVVDEDSAPVLSACLEYVWRRLGRCSGLELAKRTRQEGGVWERAYQNGEELMRWEDVKNDSTL